MSFVRGVFILDKLIGDLKSKLPFLNKKKTESEDEELSAEENSDEESGLSDDKTDSADISDFGDATQTDLSDSDDDSEKESKSIVDKLKKQFSSLSSKFSKKKSSYDDSLEGEDESEDVASKSDDEAKKKKSLIIKVFIVGSLVVILLYDEIFPPENPAPEEPTVKLQPKYKKNKPQVTEPPVTEPPVTEPQVTEPQVTEPQVTEPQVTEPQVTEPQVTEPQVTEPQETEPQETEPQVVEDNTQIGDGGFVDSTESNLNNNDVIDDTIVPSENGDFNQSVLKDLENQAGSEDLEIVQKEYVSPPDYEYMGRGLVYNCSGKHWACVDGASYKICKLNYSSVNYLKKPVECYPVNVYETQAGCETTQNGMITSNEKTNFCLGNN